MYSHSGHPKVLGILLGSEFIEQNEHAKHNTSLHKLQYECGMRFAPQLTQIVEPIIGYRVSTI